MTVTDVHKMIRDTSAALESASGANQSELAKDMVPAMQALLANLASFKDIPEHYFDNLMPAMLAQIQAVDKRTETAADQILTACETMGQILDDLPDGPKERIQEQINAIFEASNFQDLVSQHANEIKRRLEDLSDDIKDFQDALAHVASGTIPDGERVRTRDKNKRADAHLLNGPEMPD